MNEFVGPDGRIYSEDKPEEGGFLTYFDGSTWLITFPFRKSPDRDYYFFGDRLPSTIRDWRMRHVANSGTFPAFIEC